MELRYKYRFNFIRFLGEAFIIVLSFVFTFVLIKLIYKKDSFVLIHIWMLPLLIVGWYFSSRNTKSDDDFDSKTIPDLYKIANSIFIQFCLVILFFFTARQTYNTKRFLFIYISLLCILIPLEKVLNKKLMLFLNNKGVYKKRILIVGAGKTGMEFFNILNSNRHLGYEVIGFLDDEEKTFLNEQYLGKTGKIEDLLADPLVKFDEVVVALPNNAHDKIKYIADLVGRQPVKLRIIPAYHELINTSYNVSILYGLPMITLRNEPLDNIHFSLIKRIFDILFSSIVVFSICSWLFPIIALAIVLDSKGPVFLYRNDGGKEIKKSGVLNFGPCIFPLKMWTKTMVNINRQKKMIPG